MMSPPQNKYPLFACITVFARFSESLLYRIPQAFQPVIQIGSRVYVPVQSRKITGYVVELFYDPPPTNPGFVIREVIDLLNPEPMFTAEMLGFFKKISAYYFSPLSEVIQTALPKGLNRETRRYAKLTQAGENHLDCKLQGSPLFLLAKLQNTPLPRVFKQEPQISPALLLQLEKQGLIEVIQKEHKQGVQQKLEKFYRLKGPIDQGLKLSPKEKRIVELFQAPSEISHNELSRKVSAPQKPIFRLLQKGILDCTEKVVYRDPYSADDLLFSRAALAPTADQEQVIAEIGQAIAANTFKGFLLHGITGSGKTLVYIKCIEFALTQNKGALLIVPEIALTPQLMTLFRAHFGNQVAVLHSNLTDNERYDQWMQLLQGKCRIGIGARSAIFAPLPNLGLIIVDEEHENSFKQEDRLRYQARDLAVLRANAFNVTVVLGSATPSLESYQNCLKGKYTLLTLTQRIGEAQLPEVKLIDLFETPFHKEALISDPLIAAISRNLNHQEQTILFLNKRGFHSVAFCKYCRESVQCQSCSVSLTYHKKERSLQCHYCDYKTAVIETCPRCGRPLLYLGVGTERVEEFLHKQFPSARLLRMDSDSINTHRKLKKALKRIFAREVDIILGTQIVAKGHDFPNVTLVGILLADQGLNLPDLRASERTFQLITQVSGRAGRAEKPGKVLIQTFNPHHYSIQAALHSDYRQFVDQELFIRNRLNYPPFTHLILLRLQGKDPVKTEGQVEAISQIAARLRLKEKFQRHIQVVGPSIAPIFRVKEQFRYQILIKGVDRMRVREFFLKWSEQIKATPELSQVNLTIDIDPVNMF